MRVVLGLLLTLCANAALANPTVPVFEQLKGTWQGQGEVRGMAAEPRMTWRDAIGDGFIQLEFDNTMRKPDGTDFRFQAHGYYRVRSDGTISGVWLDSRGVILLLTGTTPDATTLLIEWGGDGTERGRTEYKLDGDLMQVTDWVQLPDGSWRIFGRTELSKLLSQHELES